MLHIRTDRLTKRLLYLTVLLGVIGTTAHAETTQLGTDVYVCAHVKILLRLTRLLAGSQNAEHQN